jgi:hypothetical protein
LNTHRELAETALAIMDLRIRGLDHPEEMAEHILTKSAKSDKPLEGQRKKLFVTPPVKRLAGTVDAIAPVRSK